MKHNNIESNNIENVLLYSCLKELGLEYRIIFLRNPDDINFWSCVVELSSSTNNRKFVGSSIDISPEKAKLKAISEGIERYFLANPQQTSYPSLAEQNNNYLAQHQWPTFSDAQLLRSDKNKIYQKYIAEDITHWVSVCNLLNKKELLVPASLIWLAPYSDRFSPGVSSGAACHFDQEKALLYGIFEIIERDAFSIFWESKTLPPTLSLNSIPTCKNINYIFNKLSAKQFGIKIFDITSDLKIPVYCVMIYSIDGKRPNLALGASCHINRKTALDKAIMEAYQTWCWMVDEVQKDNTSFNECLSHLENPREMIYHPLLYTFKESNDYCHFMFHNAKNIDWDSYQDKEIIIANQLNFILKKLSEANLEVYYRDIGNDITKHFSLAVTRVVIPSLVSLSIGFFGKHLANPRLKTVPRAMNWLGYENIIFNDYPHPFP